MYIYVNNNASSISISLCAVLDRPAYVKAFNLRPPSYILDVSVRMYLQNKETRVNGRGKVVQAKQRGVGAPTCLPSRADPINYARRRPAPARVDLLLLLMSAGAQDRSGVS